jgi:aminopeptidase N
MFTVKYSDRRSQERLLRNAKLTAYDKGLAPVLSTTLLGLLFATAPVAPPVAGVPETLANERVAVIRDLRYELSFRIPEKKSEPIHGVETVRFELRAPHRVVLDFEQPRDRVLEVRIGGRPAAFQFDNGHLIVRASATKAGLNAIEIEFIAGDEALNRNDEFLYTLFVPARARLTFPCFDQPSLKARYALTLEIPESWQVTANGAETGDGPAAPEGRRSVRFAETKPLPTYLFAFAAGKFQVETASRDGRTFRMFHRETDVAKVARNRDAIFDLHARALAWLEDYTAIPYPWGKFDFVLIPSFQFGGMEHAGAILYNASALMLEQSATQNQMLGRASVISHETAHMWFGDMVTMRWFNDVWMKEVMANFMAAKIVNPSFPEVNHELRFLLSHYPAAYAVDRTAGTNPIRQVLANLNEAGSMYGPIIYEKAPIVMRQLELIAGEQGFRDGLREYLKKYSFANATWLNLIEILEAHNPGQVVGWSRAWVEQRGRPEMTTTRRMGGDGKLAQLTLSQRDPLRRGLVWPQRLQVALGYPDRVELVSGVVRGSATEVAKTHGMAAPLYVLPNGAGLGYGLFVLDEASRRYLLDHLEEILDPLTRGSAWVDLWENLLEKRVQPAEFFDLAMRALPRESDEQNRQRVLAYTADAFWHWLPPEQRIARAPALEALLRSGMAAASTSGAKAAWFHTFRDVVLTKDGLAWLERVWRRDEKIEGLTFAETDEIEMAQNLALREVPGWQQILAAQRDRTQNPDRKARFEFVMPSLSADPAERERLFERFRDMANRRHEPWVLESMNFLNHPLRQEHAKRFIRPSLEMLPEIQRTGDIFFPSRWVAAALSGHRSPEAAATVRDFLAKNPQLPERLRWVVLTAADELFRTSVLNPR